MQFFIAFIVITIGLCLQIEIKDKPSCFSIYPPEPNSKLTINYMISGLNEKQTDVFLQSNNGEILVKVQNTEEGRIREVLKQQEKYSFCFQNLDGAFKVASFDFDIEGVEKEFAQSEQFTMISSEISKTHRNFQSIYRNQHWLSDRENAHALILDQTEKSVQWCAAIKVAVLIVISVSQIYIVYNYFKDKDFSGQV